MSATNLSQASSATLPVTDPTSEDHTLPIRPWQLRTTAWSRQIAHQYAGKGTAESPYAVTWLPDDAENPMTYKYSYKWVVTLIAAVSVLAVTMASSMLSAAVFEIMTEFPGKTQQEYVLVTSVFVLGFVVGPLLWAPMSEVYGRHTMFVYTYIPFTAFNAAVCGAQNLEAMLVLRFFAGMFGSSALTSAGGVIADMFPQEQRGVAMGIFAAAPFLGPAIGPVAGGFLAEAANWRWVAAVIALFSLVLTILGTFFLPETYAPVLLRRRAARLSKHTDLVYRSHSDVAKPLDKKKLFTTQLQKPWELMFREPIVALMALYMSIIYAILYMQFTSFPIVFQRGRGWSPGIAGLAFIGLTVGAFAALAYIIFYENKRYAKALRAAGGYLPPEARLPTVLVGAILFPAGLFMFAWTSVPATIHWIAPIIATVIFGAGLVFLFLGIMNYLIDTYLIYAASVLAGNTVLRSIFGVVFPLFTVNMFNNLGVNWAGTLIAFLALAFAPAPFLFYIYGRRIRRSSKYAREADDLGQMIAQRMKAASAAPAPLARVMTPREEEEAVEGLEAEMERATMQSGATAAVVGKLAQAEDVESMERAERAEMEKQAMAEKH